MREFVNSPPAAPRAPFRTFCDIALFAGPELGQFRRVMCCDLGTGGFSFFDAEPPRTEFLVARFHRAAGSVNLLCEVERSAPRRDERGILRLWVQCRFVGRLNTAE